MSWTFYKILHLSSLFGAFLSLGGLWFFYAFISGRGRGGPASGKPGAKTSGGDSAKGATAAECGAFQRGRKVLLNFHGVFLFLAFTAGFGLTAKSGAVWSFWLYIKLIVWLLLAAAPYFLKKIVLQKKKSKAGAWALLAGLLALAILASAAASLKWGAAKMQARTSRKRLSLKQANRSSKLHQKTRDRRSRVFSAPRPVTLRGVLRQDFHFSAGCHFRKRNL